MPRKQNPETPEEQAQRFRKEAKRLIESGELDPAAAEVALDKLVRRAPKKPSD